MSSIRDLPYTKNIEDIAIEIILPFVNRAIIDDNPTLLKIAGEYCFLHPEKFNDVGSDLNKAQTVVRMSMIALRSGWRNFGDCNEWKNYSGWLEQMKRQ